MRDGRVKIGIVAPGVRIEPEMAAHVSAIAAAMFPANPPELYFHPQCYLSWGHFAGTDDARAEAFVEIANDPSFDALWFARGGYGSCRIADSIFARLNEAARGKTYLGYSDAGSVLAGLYRRGFPRIAHGPMPVDIVRENDSAVRRGLSYLVARSAAAIEPNLPAEKPAIALNMTILSHMLGTNLQPDFTGHVLLLEEIGEYMYRIDRMFFHITSNPGVRRAAGIMLGRCLPIPENVTNFGQTEEEVARHWCDRAGIPYLGRADIGHDVDNKVVPFGRQR